MCRTLFRLFTLTVSAAMGCLFSCFRGPRDSDPRSHRRLSNGSSSSAALASRNRISSLFLPEELDDFAHNIDSEEKLVFESPQISQELVDEAKLLKACGTLSETPMEIRKAPLRLRTSPPIDKAGESPDFCSRLPPTCIRKSPLDKQIDEPPTSAKCFEEQQMIDTASPERTPIRERSTGRTFLNSNQIDKASLVSPATNVHCTTNKSVRFKCHLDTLSPENVHPISCKLESLENLSVSRPSPRPTPLKISDEMQTPGTVFPGTVDNADRKPRIRSQYVYLTSNPVNIPQWQLPKEDDPTSLLLSGEQRDNFEHAGKITTESESGLEQASCVPAVTLDASLSPKLKLEPSIYSEDNPNFQSASSNHQFEVSAGDISGKVSANCNENETQDQKVG